MAKAGFQVMATLRNPEKAERLRARAAQEGVELDIRALDVASDDSVRKCMEGVKERYGRVDVLVTNAGVGHFGSLEQTPDAALRRVMEVNFFGVWRMTLAVFPAMRERRSGRIITVSSIGGLLAHPFHEAYSSSKFAVEGFMESLSQVARHLGVHVSLIQPGPVITEFMNTAMTVSNGMTGEVGPYRSMFDTFLSQARASYGTWQTGDDVAQVIIEAATAAQPHLRYVTSDDVRKLVLRKFVDPTGGSASLLHPQLAGG
jgi:short-subunit dehydrogenase